MIDLINWLLSGGFSFEPNFHTEKMYKQDIIQALWPIFPLENSRNTVNIHLLTVDNCKSNLFEV